MTKSLMISIHKKHVDNIKNKLKTLELRTWLPKLNGLKGIWVYIYEPLKNGGIGGVIGRFWFDEFIKLEWLDPSLNVKRNDVNYYNYYALFGNVYNNIEWVLPKLCLTKQQVIDYGKERDLYAWHIKKLEVFDEPKYLSDFALVSNYKHIVENMTPYEKSMLIFGNTLKKAPQKMAWVYVNE